MKRLLDTHWLLYGSSGVPSWVVWPAFVLGAVLLVRWYKAERRTRTWLAYTIPVTGCLLLALSAWLVWRPVLVRVDNWEHTSEVLGYVDTSGSMASPLASGEATALLDNVAFWRPGLDVGRTTLPRDVRREVSASGDACDQLIASLAEALSAMEQGVPAPGRSADSAAGYSAWSRTARTIALSRVDEVRAMVAGLKASGSSDPPEELESVLGRYGDMAARLPNALLLTDVASINDVRNALRAFRAEIDAVAAALDALQHMNDAAVIENVKGLLGEAYDGVVSGTRADAAQLLAQVIREIPGTLSDPSRDPGQTDIWGDIRALLGASEESTVSDLVIVSDGGHNGGVTPDVADRLQRLGIRIIVAGVGRTASDADFAVLEWDAVPLARQKDDIQLSVRVKTPAENGRSFRLVLESDGKELAGLDAASDGREERRLRLTFKAPDAGQHVLSLRVDGDDRHSGNDRAIFPLMTTKTAPRALIVGVVPDWDLAYMSLAAQRAGLRLRTLYHGAEDDPPKRGGAPQSIPKTVSQWSRQDLIVLAGRPFAGMQDDDAQALLEAVSQGGSSLVLLVADESYLSALAPAFGWPAEADRVPQGSRMRVPLTARHLPILRVAEDGARSARTIRSLGACREVWSVPAQQRVLIEADDGSPVCSMGFYGKGRVYLVGLRGLSAISEYGRAQVVDRLLSQLCSDGATPLFPSEEDQLASYPRLPAVGTESTLIVLDEAASEATAGPGAHAVTLSAGTAMQWGSFTAETAGEYPVKASGAGRSLQAVDNPGLEQIHFEFDEAFLRSIARASGGVYVGMNEAREKIAAIRPTTWQAETSVRYPLADHGALFLLVVVLGTAHWALRKLSGLPI